MLQIDATVTSAAAEPDEQRLRRYEAGMFTIDDEEYFTEPRVVDGHRVLARKSVGYPTSVR